jgi:hypothetical protein
MVVCKSLKITIVHNGLYFSNKKCQKYIMSISLSVLINHFIRGLPITLTGDLLNTRKELLKRLILLKEGL